jgi:hypothetical protein
MTPAAFKFTVENFETFCQWFDRKEFPDHATWEMIRADFDTMKASVEYLIERERARLAEKPATPPPAGPAPDPKPEP